MKKILFTILLVFVSFSTFAYDFKQGAFVDFSVTYTLSKIWIAMKGGSSILPEYEYSMLLILPLSLSQKTVMDFK